MNKTMSAAEGIAFEDIDVVKRSILERVERLHPGLPPAQIDPQQLIALEFDVDFYVLHNPDVAVSDLDPLDHYVRFGWREGRDPTPWFSSRDYLRLYQDVEEVEIDPFWHYLAHGIFEDRVIQHSSEFDAVKARLSNIPVDEGLGLVAKNFDGEFYLGEYADVAAAGIDPVQHFYFTGWREGRNPTAWFDTSYYAEVNQISLTGSLNPFLHYIAFGADLDLRCAPTPEELQDRAISASCDIVRPYFDEHFYLSKYADIGGSGIDPLWHYMVSGWREMRDPSPEFSTKFYLENNQDIAVGGINPFQHYVLTGKNEGRSPKHPAGSDYDKLMALKPLSLEAESWTRDVSDVSKTTVSKFVRALRALPGHRSGGMMVSVSHDDYRTIPGGLQLCVQREENAAKSAGMIYLHLSPLQPLPLLSDHEDTGTYYFDVRLNGERVGALSASDLSMALRQVSASHTARHFVVHQLLGHSVTALRSVMMSMNVSDVFLWVHDYFTLCPSYALLRNSLVYCGAPPETSNSCEICLHGQDRKLHLSAMRQLFGAVNVHVLSPSRVALDIWMRNAPLEPASAGVVPHTSAVNYTSIASPEMAKDVVRYAFVGTMSDIKGWDEFLMLARKFKNDKSKEFICFGSKDPLCPYVEFVNVHVAVDSQYAMRDALIDHDVHYVVHWAKWPETYSISTIEAIAAGCRVLTNMRSGNVRVIVESSGKGAVFDTCEAMMDFVATTTHDDFSAGFSGASEREVHDYVFSRMTLEALTN